MNSIQFGEFENFIGYLYKAEKNSKDYNYKKSLNVKTVSRDARDTEEDHIVLAVNILFWIR